jgi:hypothetical protein
MTVPLLRRDERCTAQAVEPATGHESARPPEAAEHVILRAAASALFVAVVCLDRAGLANIAYQVAELHCEGKRRSDAAA